MRVLDVGCGTGELLQPLAQLLGPSGHITGVDLSEMLIAEGQRRVVAAEASSPIDLRVADALALPFADDSFDVVTANLLLQHLPAPDPALAEMARVLRPGGSILIVEQDWDSLLISHSDRALTRRIIHHFCDAVPNGWIARQLPAAIASAGFVDCSLTGTYQTLSAAEWTDPAMGFSQLAARACVSKAITSDEQSRWESEITERLHSGTFHCGFTMFRASATLPG